ncbi:MAG: DNA polymerase III subunit delta' [Rhodospirillaceae bacterium]
MADDQDTTPPNHPRLTEQLIGHGEAVADIASALQSGRMAHAWLISGPRGIGKATLAYHFARCVLSGALSKADEVPEGPKEFDGPGLFGEALPEALAPSGQSTHETEGAGLPQMDPDDPVFRQVARKAHPDMRMIEAEFAADGKPRQSIPVDDIRSLGHVFAMTSSGGGWRVVLVDGAEEMTPGAANALLKILEEPPDRALLLLISHAPDRLLPTILSRCRRLALRPLDGDALRAVLQSRAPELAEDDLALAQAMAAGSPGRALELVEQGGVDLLAEGLALLGADPARDAAGVTEKLHKLGDRCARDESLFRRFGDLTSWWLAGSVRALAQASARGTGFGATNWEGSDLPNARAALDRLIRYAEGQALGGAAAPLEPLVELWENSGRSFRQARALHLDRKLVLLDWYRSFSALS